VLKRVWNGIFGASIGSRILLLSSSSILAQSIVVASLPLVSRLFSPAELGLAALVTVALNFAIPVICLRYDGALPLARRASDAARLVWISLASAIVVSALFFLCFQILQANNLLGFGILPDWTRWIVLAACPGIAFFALGQAWWLRQRRASVIGANLILRAAVHNGVRIASGIGGGGVVGLMLAEAAMALTSLKMALHMPWRRIVLVTRGRDRLWMAARRWRRFPLIEGPSALVDSIAVFLPVPIVTMLYGIDAAGLFTIAVRIGSIPIGQIGSAVSSAAFMDFSSAARAGNIERMLSLFNKIFLRLLLAGLPAMLALAILGPVLAGPLLGAQWQESGIYLAMITPWLYVQLAVVPLSRIMSVLQRQDLKLLVDFFFLGATILSFVMARGLGLDIRQYVLVLTALMVVSYLFYFSMIRIALRAAKERQVYSP
jgi:O-antigen/teichoic acid export membrane protein